MTIHAKVKRNDPCPCGSGAKYKQCCQPRERAEQAERVAWDRAAKDMRVALIGFAKDEAFTKDLGLALGLFWQDRYTLETVHRMSVDESLRFFDWFAHDYRLQAQDDETRDGRRLIQVYRDEVCDALDEREAATLDGWIESPPGSAFVLESADPAAATVVLRDMLVADRVLTVHDASAARHGEIGQILLARPLPEGDRVRLAGATVILPAEEGGELRDLVEKARQAYLAEHEGATDAQFLRDRSYLLTHYALHWAERSGRPAVAAQDPESDKAVRTLVKWQQDRVKAR